MPLHFPYVFCKKRFSDLSNETLSQKHFRGNCKCKRKFNDIGARRRVCGITGHLKKFGHNFGGGGAGVPEIRPRNSCSWSQCHADGWGFLVLRNFLWILYLIPGLKIKCSKEDLTAIGIEVDGADVTIKNVSFFGCACVMQLVLSPNTNSTVRSDVGFSWNFWLRGLCHIENF